MLVLSRRKDQRIRIGDDIEIVVVEASRGKVRIGIEAPREVRVIRPELLEREAQAGIGGSSNEGH